ncbi:hypothetical protein AB4Z30_12820 [Paenibacillus sp. 2TAF8]|uniref:hypothetical protein n=1 Tax=Paenibacillus sp. 2TAF8 TaxID=3233020 RepID=UPI003F9C9324
MMKISFLCREFERTQMLVRWISVFVVLVIISWVRLTTMFSSEIIDVFDINVWDSIFAVINHPNLLMFAYVPIFLVLMSDLLFSSTIEHEYVNLLRLTNRNRWFAHKISLLAFNVLLYMLLLVAIPTIVSMILGRSVGWDWSAYSKFIFNHNYIMAHVPENFSNVAPFWVVLLYGGLLSLTFMALGVISICFVLWVENGYGGSVITYVLLLCNHILMSNISLSKYMFLNNLSPEAFSRNESSISIYIAFLGISILLITSLLCGVLVCKKRDFLSKEHTRY